MGSQADLAAQASGSRWTRRSVSTIGSGRGRSRSPTRTRHPALRAIPRPKQAHAARRQDPTGHRATECTSRHGSLRRPRLQLRARPRHPRASRWWRAHGDLSLPGRQAPAGVPVAPRWAHHLSLPGRDVDLPYSTVSDAVMQRVVEVVRRRYSADRSSLCGVVPDTTADADATSFCFERLLRERRDLRHTVAGTPGHGAGQGQGHTDAAPPRARRRRQAPSQILHPAERSRADDPVERAGVRLSLGRRLPGGHRVRPGGQRPRCDLGERRAQWGDDLVLRTDGGPSRFLFTEDNPTLAPYSTFLSSLVSTTRAAGAASA